MYQPPAYSPAGPGDILGALVEASVGRGGRARRRLRDLLIERYAADDVALLASGTQSLELAIRLAQGTTGTGVTALPAYTCFDVGTAAIGAGSRITFFDIDPETLSPPRDEILRVLDAGARVIVVSPLFGIPVDWDAVAGPAAEAGAVVVSDASQATGARWRGRPLGALGDLGVLSFGRGKGWTGGGGGAVLVHPGSDTRAPTLPSMDDHGRSGVREAAASAVQWALGRPGLYGIPARLPGLGLGETRYHSPTPPSSIPDFCAALAFRTADEAEAAASARRDVARSLAAALTIPGVRCIRPPAECEPGFLRFPVLVEGPGRGEVLPDRFRRLGMSGGYPLPLPSVPEIAAHGFDGPARFEGAETLARTLVTLPTHRFIGPSQVSTLTRAVVDLLEA